MLKSDLNLKNRNILKGLTKKRFACAHCGNTWIELDGLVVWGREGNEDVLLRIGMESDNCQTCRFRFRECQKCGSKDVYEISYLGQVSREVPLSFKAIKNVSWE